MSTYFAYGHKSVFRTRAEAERLVTERYDSAQKHPAAPWHGKELLDVLRDAIKPVEVEADILFNKTGTCGGGFSLWSDGRLRMLSLCEVYRPTVDGKECAFLLARAVAIPNSPVTDAGQRFVSTCLGADSDQPAWLGRVRDVVEEKPLSIGADRGVWARKTITMYRLKLDTEERTVFVFTVGYFEGYAFDVYESLTAASAALEPPPCQALECLECGAVFETPGHVEHGQMGCTRCSPPEPSANSTAAAGVALEYADLMADCEANPDEFVQL